MGQRIYQICTALILLFPPHLKAQESVELDYTYLPAQTSYNLRLKLITRCDAAFNLPLMSSVIRILDYGSGQYSTVALGLDTAYFIQRSVNPCIVSPDPPCYKETIYQGDVSMAPSIPGYLLIWQGCCRADSNLAIPALYPASPYVANYPLGANGLTLFEKVQVSASDPTPYSSPQFGHNSVLVFCKDQPFSFLYNATDAQPDDSIRYGFVPLYGFGVTPPPPGAPGAPPPPPNAPPPVPSIIFKQPYPLIDFRNPYSAGAPLGPKVQIDPVTGLISGTPADTGIFQLSVIAYKYEKGRVVAFTKRELEITIYDCPHLPKAVARIPALINRCNTFQITMPDSSTTDRIYSWDFGDGTGLSGFGDAAYAPSHAYPDTGTYRVRLIVNPGYYCADTSSSTALVYPFLLPHFSYLDSCAAQPIHFFNNSSTSLGTITSTHWNFNDLSDPPDTSDQASPTFSYPRGDTTYSIFMTSTTSLGCSNTDTQNLSLFNPPPKVSLDTFGVWGQSLQLNAYNALDGLDDQLQWTPPSGLSNDMVFNPLVYASSATDLKYQLLVTNRFGCTRSDSFEIKYYKGPAIYVPTAFTPNGDGRNDLLRPTLVGMLGFQFRVFNRWGNLVYQTSQFRAGWDGNFRGRPAPPGTYVWEINTTDENHKPIQQEGTVLLLR